MCKVPDGMYTIPYGLIPFHVGLSRTPVSCPFCFVPQAASSTTASKLASTVIFCFILKPEFCFFLLPGYSRKIVCGRKSNNNLKSEGISTQTATIHLSTAKNVPNIGTYSKSWVKNYWGEFSLTNWISHNVAEYYFVRTLM